MNEIIKDIGHILLETVPKKKWESLVSKLSIISSYSQLNAVYLIGDEEFSFDPNEGKDKEYDIGELFFRLREEMYNLNPKKGAWFFLVLEVNNSGQFNVKFDYDLKPSFIYEPEIEEYREDFKKFPRDNEYIPAWFNEMLQK